jgi:hypothetical protein
LGGFWVGLAATQLGGLLWAMVAAAEREFARECCCCFRRQCFQLPKPMELNWRCSRSR